MTYVARTYDAIVRDLLTTLTGGTVRESLTAPAPGATFTPLRLADRPVRRVSHMEGEVAVGTGPDAPRLPYRFTDADFEVISTSGDPAGADAIRFRPDGHAPVPGTLLTVNYYPTQTGPVPVNDLNVGSVVRTLLETVARELAETYGQLEFVYRSAFLETAEASALDAVVALVGVRRLAAGHPVARIRFGRGGGGAATRVTVPAGTVVTDDAGARYLTVADVTLEAGEPSREVLAAGESAATPLVDAGALDRPEVLIAGIAEVINPQPALAAGAAETDEELRRRARGALHGVTRGTLDALRFGLLSIDGVKGLQIVEAPNGVNGDVDIIVAYENPSDARVQEIVARTIEELRPAGIRVNPGIGARLRADVHAELTLAGTGVSGAEQDALRAACADRLGALLLALPPGGIARRAQLTAAALADDRIVDAAVELRPEGRTAAAELTLADGEVLELGAVEVTVVATEAAAPAGAIVSSVSAVLPVHLQPGVTAAAATAAIDAAVDTELATRGPGAPLTVDGIAAAIRDDSRYVLVRADAQVTVEAGERFLQLTDGVGSYEPVAGETLRRATISVDVREGGA